MYYLLKFHISYLRWRLFLNSAISVCSRPCPLHLALPSLSVVSVSLLSCCLGVLLCDIHFNHFILHLVAHRWALDGWKFIKRSTDHYLPPENGLIDFVHRGGGITAWRCGLCLRSLLLIICTNCFCSLSGWNGQDRCEISVLQVWYEKYQTAFEL